MAEHNFKVGDLVVATSGPLRVEGLRTVTSVTSSRVQTQRGVSLFNDKFDITGGDTETFWSFPNTIKKIGILELCQARARLDMFIQDYAKKMGGDE